MSDATTRGLTFIGAGQYDELAPAFDFIPNTLQDSSVAIIYGPPQSGKTFFALHLLCSTALGRPLFGLQPEKRRGLYIGLEGEAGIKARIMAWCAENGAKKSPIHYALGSFDIADEDQRAELIEYIREHEIQFVVIDTLARTMTGLDEIAGKDMSLVIDALHEIKAETGACIVAIAHTGKDVSAGIRGHSSQLGNVDTTIELDSAAPPSEALTHTTPRRARVRKQRDGETGTQFYFRLARHETPLRNARGEPVCSVAVSDCEAFKDWEAQQARTADAAKFTDREREALDVLADMTRLTGSPSIDQLRRTLKRRRWADTLAPAAWRKAFQRLADKLDLDSNGSVEYAR